MGRVGQVGRKTKKFSTSTPRGKNPPAPGLAEAPTPLPRTGRLMGKLIESPKLTPVRSHSSISESSIESSPRRSPKKNKDNVKNTSLSKRKRNLQSDELVSSSPSKKRNINNDQDDTNKSNASGNLSDANASTNKRRTGKKKAKTVVVKPKKRLSLAIEDSMRKKRRLRSGTGALLEIKRYQKSWHTLIPRLSFSRVVKECLQAVTSKPYRIQSLALMALQESAEAYLIHLLTQSNLASIHARRVTVQNKDIKFIRRIREDFL